MQFMNKYLFKFLLICLVPIVLTVGCGRSYSYYSFKARGEEALKAKEYERAKDIYAAIYQYEKLARKQEFEHVAWAFYRLGVINELLGEIRFAKGYYWGDSIDEGFYAPESRIEWFAENGWEWLDQDKAPRSLERILELEKTRRPSKSKKAFGQKRIIKSAPVEIKKRIDTEPAPAHQPTRIFNRSRTPPPSYLPEPFKVYF